MNSNAFDHFYATRQLANLDLLLNCKSKHTDDNSATIFTRFEKELVLVKEIHSLLNSHHRLVDVVLEQRSLLHFLDKK